MTVSQRILEVMQEKHITQKKLADYTGISTSAISDWKKKGTNPSVDKIVAISECLGVSVDYLLGRTDEQNKNSITTGDINGNHNANMQVGTETSNYDTTTNQVAEMFKNMNIQDKAKVLTFMVELSNKKGA